MIGSQAADIWTMRAGRVLLATLFLAGFLQKLLDPQPVIQMLASVYLPAILVWPVAAFNLLASVMLVAGVGLRPLGFALAGYCVLTSFFHLIPSDAWQMSIMVKNWAIAGGCLILASGVRSDQNSGKSSIAVAIEQGK